MLKAEWFGMNIVCAGLLRSARNDEMLANMLEVRIVWNEQEEKWYFSVVDVVGVLTESENPRRYLSDLKIKLKKEGSQLYENIVQLK